MLHLLLMSVTPARWDRLPERLAQLVYRSGLTKRDFAARCGIDRTTVSELLSRSAGRAPRLETLLAVATTFEVSLDWLVGAVDEPNPAPELLEHTRFERPGQSPTDSQIYAWLTEEPGTPVRYIPATLPDLLKTDAVIRFEQQPTSGPTPAQSIETTAARLAWARNSDTQMECCSSIQALRGFARGEGIWQRLSTSSRREQLERMIELCDELYPAFRWNLFDGLAHYAAPVTIFGRRRAALYLGDLYLVLTGPDHVRQLSRHFDSLVKAAAVPPSSMVSQLQRLRRELDR